MSGPGWLPVDDHRTLGDVVAEVAGRFGDKLAFVVDDVELSFADTHRRSDDVARALADIGVRRGDRVAMLMENCVELVDVVLACGKIGAIEVALNTANRGTFLQHQLENCDPAVLIVDDAYARLPPDAALPHLRAVLVHPTADPPETPSVPDYGVAVAGSDRLYGAPGQGFSADDPPDYRDPLAIIYTSGTTGLSKGVVISHRYLLNASGATFLRRGCGAEDVVFTPLPLYHLNAHLNALIGPYLHGATGVIDRHFSVSRFWERVDAYHATVLSILGAQLSLVWGLPPSERDRQRGLRVLVGAPVTKEMAYAWQERFGLNTSQGYALTEACPVTSSPIATSPPGSSGQAVDTVEVRLFDDHDEEVPSGEVGEICVRPRSPFVMFSEYWRAPEATLQVWRNGWFHTGDLGRFDDQGYLYFVDRKKDYLRRRGENISSFEVETALRAHPAIAEAAVVGVPSELGEQDCLAVVVSRDGHTLDAWEVVRHCVDSMPFYAVPRYIQVVDDLPRTPTGKVEKYRVRQIGVTPDTFDLEAAGYRVNRTGLVAVDADTGRTTPAAAPGATR